MISSSYASVPHLGFGGARSLIGALVCTTLLFFAAPAYAISETICAAEQEAFIKASIDDQVNPEVRKLSGMEAYIKKQEDEVRAYLWSGDNDTIPWHIKDTLNIKTARDAAAVLPVRTGWRRRTRRSSRSSTPSHIRAVGTPASVPMYIKNGLQRRA